MCEQCKTELTLIVNGYRPRKHQIGENDYFCPKCHAEYVSFSHPYLMETTFVKVGVTLHDPSAAFKLEISKLVETEVTRQLNEVGQRLSASWGLNKVLYSNNLAGRFGV